MTAKKKNPLWKRIWGLAAFLEVGNDYVTDGDPEYSNKLAPLALWIRALRGPLGSSALITATIFLAERYLCIKFSTEFQPGNEALTIVSSLLGFGIGVYALIFGVSNSLVQNIQASHNIRNAQTVAHKSSVLSLNSAFAFPLLFMVITIVVSLAQKALPNYTSLKYCTWFLLISAMMLAFQLIHTLYKLGKNVLLDKLPEPENPSQ